MDFLRRTWAEIDIAALKHNFELLKSGTHQIMAVVKADAYGHDAVYIAPILEQAGCEYFAVSNIEEAIDLRKSGVSKPILVLGYTPVNFVRELSSYKIIQCVYSSEYAQMLSECAQKQNVIIQIHIKLDTGMGRIGFNCRNEQLSGLNDAIKSATLKGLQFKGILTHFASSDRNIENDDGFTQKQYSLFLKAIDKFKGNGLNPEVCHCCNSAAFSLDKDKHLSFCRAGIVLYGLTPSSTLKLKENFIPVMTLKSVVSMIKEINKGESVSYGRTFKADKNLKIATIPCGYADGYPRLLSNKGYVLIKGKKAPILGRICMDQFVVDITDIKNVNLEDEVILFGKELPVEILADMCDTINYEIVCGISKRVPRIFIGLEGNR